MSISVTASSTPRHINEPSNQDLPIRLTAGSRVSSCTGVASCRHRPKKTTEDNRSWDLISKFPSAWLRNSTLHLSTHQGLIGTIIAPLGMYVSLLSKV
ncbi:hypothetical protein KC340_g121 [Hortaea werneckii]|nr:hypothetical protein KC340_g121 [Hortaea werneckii]